MSTIIHEDFGEKIGGARKDVWAERGLYTSDLDKMNDREATKYVIKDNIWKKPDYQELLDSGIDKGVVFYRKKVRDSIIAKPQFYASDTTPEKILARQKQYIETIRTIKEGIEAVKTKEDVLDAFKNILEANKYVEHRGYNFLPGEKGENNPVINNKLFKNLYVHNSYYYNLNYVEKAKKEQFGVSKEEKIPKGYAIHLYDGNGYSKGDDWKEGTYYITKGYTIVETNIPTYTAAVKRAQEIGANARRGGKSKFIPPQLEHVQRTGIEYRDDKDVVGQDYIKAFRFKGGEYGNWLNQKDRQASLNMGYDALKDLAYVLDISDKDISYNGVLSIAFGARGRGNAAAHYEPLRKVINLTKMHGAGSLAHEWWHGLDDFLGSKMNSKGYLSTDASIYKPMQELITVIKYRTESESEARARVQARDNTTVNTAERYLDSAVLYHINAKGDEVKTKYTELKQRFLKGDTYVLDEINALKKEYTKHVIPKSELDVLRMYGHWLFNFNKNSNKSEQTLQLQQVPTEYYLNSKKMSEYYERDGGYWESEIELTARAFACYVYDKIKPNRSDYLCGHAECAVGMVPKRDGGLEVIKAFPCGDERKRINAAFDKLFETLIADGVFTKRTRQEEKQRMIMQEQNNAVKNTSNEARFRQTVLSLVEKQGKLCDVHASLKTQYGYTTLTYDELTAYMRLIKKNII